MIAEKDIPSFEDCTIAEVENGWVKISCANGLWSVAGKDFGVVEREAGCYWRQYLADGEYTKPY